MAGWTSRSLFAARQGKQHNRRDGKAFSVGGFLRCGAVMLFVGIQNSKGLKDTKLHEPCCELFHITIACIVSFCEVLKIFTTPHMAFFIFILDKKHPGMRTTWSEDWSARFGITRTDTGHFDRFFLLKFVVKLDHAKYVTESYPSSQYHRSEKWDVSNSRFLSFGVVLHFHDYGRKGTWNIVWFSMHIHDVLFLQEEFHFELYKETLQELGFSHKDLLFGGFLWFLGCLIRPTWMVCWDGKKDVDSSINCLTQP